MAGMTTTPHAQPQFKSKVQVRGNYIGGRFALPTDANGEWTAKSPADFADELGKIPYSYASVNEAVGAARKAFPAWRRKSLSERAELLKKYQSILKRREDELAEILAREVGKPLWESKTEVATMVNKVDVTLNDSMKLVADLTLPNVMEGTNGVSRHRPLGVMAVIGPFNFPGHLPNGHIVPALATGNTIVFKPSEKAPLTAQLMAECFEEAGFPAGVFNLLQGEKEVGRRLCVHEDVAGILFTGSYEVGTRIKQDTLLQHWKLLALEMGGKNAAIVWKDTDLELAVHETLFGAFVTSGQRCSATSRVIVHKSLADKFIERFHERAKAFTIGHPLDNPFMGPLVEAGSVDRYLKFFGIASREGCEVLMRGKALELPYQGYYVTPSICLVQDSSIEGARKSVYQQTELFAPNVGITVVEDIEHAIALANITQYGLVASVFTRDRATYETCWDGLEFGLVNWNRTTVGASSKLPFGGLKKSGNHFPTALPSTLYCTYPVASLETAEPKPVNPTSPGLNWK
jgi:succinylglutamic semialdehyde dehydrogenase